MHKSAIMFISFVSSLGFAINEGIIDASGGLCSKSAASIDDSKQHGLGFTPNANGDYATFATEILPNGQSQSNGFICESSGKNKESVKGISIVLFKTFVFSFRILAMS